MLNNCFVIVFCLRRILFPFATFRGIIIIKRTQWKIRRRENYLSNVNDTLSVLSVLWRVSVDFRRIENKERKTEIEIPVPRLTTIDLFNQCSLKQISQTVQLVTNESVFGVQCSGNRISIRIF